MPFKPSRFVLCRCGNCYAEPRVVRKADHTYKVEYQDPRNIVLPSPAESNLGALLEAGVQLNEVRTSIMETSQPLFINKKINPLKIRKIKNAY